MRLAKLVLAIPLVLLLGANSKCVLETDDDDDEDDKPKTQQQTEADGAETR
jgi:hypothetical protein